MTVLEETNARANRFYKVRARLLTGDKVLECDWLEMRRSMSPEWWQDIENTGGLLRGLSDSEYPKVQLTNPLYKVLTFPTNTDMFVVHAQHLRTRYQGETRIPLAEFTNFSGDRQLFLDRLFVQLVWDMQIQQQESIEERNEYFNPFDEPYRQRRDREIPAYDMAKKELKRVSNEIQKEKLKPVDLPPQTDSKPKPKDTPKPFSLIELE